MYSPSSPALNSFEGLLVDYQSNQCLKFKYFATFLVCTTCLGLLTASLATQKWIVAKPVRSIPQQRQQALHSTTTSGNNALSHQTNSRPPPPAISSAARLINDQRTDDNKQVPQSLLAAAKLWPSIMSANDTKFQGEIHFGLFCGLKTLNYGFGDRVSQLSVIQSFVASKQHFDASHQQQLQPPPSNSSHLVSFKLWLATLASVLVATLFGFAAVVLAIVNFVVEPETTINGPIGFVICNLIASFASFSAAACWLVEFHTRLNKSVLTSDDLQNGWSSKNRAFLGFSYYFVVAAALLYMTNVFAISLFQFKTLTKKRHARAVCENVTMLY